MPNYEIDNSDVNSREDWKLQRQPAQLGMRARRRFPGDPNVFTVKGPLLPRRFRITGFLIASSISNLQSLLDSYEQMQADTTLHQITIHGETYENLDLASFEQTGRIQPNGNGVRCPVAFNWEQLQR